MPLDIGIKIGEEEPVRLLNAMIEEMDLSALRKASRRTQKQMPDAESLFKLDVFGRMNGVYSARALEMASKYDLRYMWLLGGRKAPDHNTIARFRKEVLTQVSEGLFYQLVEKLYEMGEIDFENVFVDGTKEEANANRYSFVWKKVVTKNEAKLNAKITAHIERIQREYLPLLGPDASLDAIRTQLYAMAQAQGIAFVHGKGKRKTALQRDIEELEALRERSLRYESYEGIFGDRNSFSKTDPDATFMRMKEDHMKNGQLKPGYNVQIGVEAEYIVGVEIGSECNDLNMLIPLLETMFSHTGRRHANVIADAGYESEENYQYLAANGQVSYIKPQNYEKSQTRAYQKNGFIRENMPYDEENDRYTCPAGKQLNPVGKKTRKSKSGHKAEVTVYECTGCAGCPLRQQCTRAKGNRRMEVSKAFLPLRAKSLANITSEQGILLRVNRSIQVEGAFGVIKENYGFRRFLSRGKQNVRMEFLLLAFAYNINKLHAKIQTNRTGVQLHTKMTA